VIRALTAASRASYEADLGGLAAAPVLGPRGVLLLGQPDQRTTLDALQAEAAPDCPGLERLDAAATLAMVPILRPDQVTGGLFDPDSQDLDVAAIHQAYLRAFGARGGQVITNAEVTGVGNQAAPWQIETRAGRFEAAVVVDAAGAWADQVAGLFGVRPLGLTPKRRTAILLEPSVAVDPAWPLVLDADETFYFKPESGLLLGSPADETPIAPCDVQPEELDVALAIERIERAADLHVLRVRRKWAGLRTFAADHTLVIGMDEQVPGFFWLAGQGGYGIQTAPAAARTAAKLLVDGVLPDDLLAQGVLADHLLPARLRTTPRPIARDPRP
jgi:D-arginine dehydrogenase